MLLFSPGVFPPSLKTKFNIVRAQWKPKTLHFTYSTFNISFLFKIRLIGSKILIFKNNNNLLFVLRNWSFKFLGSGTNVLKLTFVVKSPKNYWHWYRGIQNRACLILCNRPVGKLRKLSKISFCNKVIALRSHFPLYLKPPDLKPLLCPDEASKSFKFLVLLIVKLQEISL